MTARSTGLFLQEKLVLDRWVFRAGGRFNRSRQSYEIVDGLKPDLADKAWDSRLWSVGARYNLTPQLSFYGNIGSSFLTPSAKSVVGTIAAGDVGIVGRNGQLPNPGLEPERGTGSDFGVEFRTDAGLSLGLRAFFNQINDAIVDNVVSATPSQSQSVNAGRARGCGGEVTLDYAMSPGFAWFANLTVSSSRVKNALAADQDGTAIPFVPDFVANAGFTVKLPHGIVAAPRLQLVGDYYDSTSRFSRQRFGSYQVLNLRVQGPVYERSGCALRWTLDLNNLFDRRYAMPWQFRDPGFNAFFSVGCDF